MRCAALFVVILFCIGAALGDDKATSLSEARAEIEANLKTPEGKAYDETLSKEFLEKHLQTMKQCKQQAGKDAESFWILMKLGKDGAVREVLLHPANRMGECARESLLKSRLSAPPRAEYWVGVYVKLMR